MRRSSHQRRRQERAAKSPTLATIPETTSVAAAPFQRDRHFFSDQEHRRRARESKKHGCRLRPHHFQLCLLALAPGYVLYTSRLLLRHRPSHSGSLSRLRPQQPGQRRRSRWKMGKTDVVAEGNGHVDIEQFNGRRRMSTKRVVMLSSDNDEFDYSDHVMNEILRSIETTEATDGNHDKSYNTVNNRTDCVPMAEWQTRSFPTCNSFHELNMFASSTTLTYVGPRRQQKDGLRFHRFPDTAAVDRQRVPVSETDSVKLLGNGWFRHAWQLASSSGDRTALKTLRLERDFLPEYFELHRRDAVAMERLTASPYVMNIYGHCGMSALTELAYGNGVDNLYRLSTGLKGVNSPYVLQTKLQISAMVSLGLADVHGVSVDADSGERPKKKPPLPSIAHYDINPRNIIVTPSGKPKLNDFNVAEFLTWNAETHEQCGFKARLHEPWWRSPEEMVLYNGTVEVFPTKMLSEKVDVYSLGSVLYVLLTGSEPRGRSNKKERYKSVSNVVARGELPSFEHSNSTDPSVLAIWRAIRLCWEPDPRIRPAAIEIARDLFAAIKQQSDRT